jgi:DNA-binding transcriptional ArsR family regulator
MPPKGQERDRERAILELLADGISRTSYQLADITGYGRTSLYFTAEKLVGIGKLTVRKVGRKKLYTRKRDP